MIINKRKIKYKYGRKNVLNELEIENVRIYRLKGINIKKIRKNV